MADTAAHIAATGSIYGGTESYGTFVELAPIIGAQAVVLGALEVSSTSGMTVEVWDDENATLVGDLPNSFSRRFQDRLSDLGSGEVSVLVDDDDADLLVVGNHVRFLIDGQYAFTFVITQRDVVMVVEDEESAQVLKASGDGVASMLRTGVVYPHGGVSSLPVADQRPFSWASPEYDSSGWSPVVVQYDRIARQLVLDPPLHEPWFPPKGWPTPLSVDWIWTRTRATDTSNQHPAGRCYFRKTITLGSAQTLMFFLAADDRARVFIDGKTVMDWTAEFPEDSFLDCWRAGVPVSAGDHIIGIEAETYTGNPERPRRGMVALAVHEAPTTGTYSDSTLVVGTDSTWRCLDYPLYVPAPTPGKVLETLLDEAQDRGALAGWTWSFTQTADSSGTPWDAPYEFVARVGDDLVAVLKSLSQWAIDWHADPAGRRLHAWNKGAAGAVAATYTAGVDLFELVHTERI